MKFIQKYLVNIIFFSCIILIIYWVYSQKTPNNVLLSVVTGYISGYIIYFLTVLLPILKKKKAYTNDSIKKLSIIYQRSIYLLLLIYKDCSPKSEWEKIIKKHKYDIDFIDDTFIDTITKFDITNKAYSIFKNEDKTPYNWAQYLTIRYETMYNQLNEIFLYYQNYLNDDIIETVIELKNCSYFDMFLGNGFTLENQIILENGDIHYEPLPISLLLKSNNSIKCVFEKSDNEPNKMLIDYISIIKKLYSIIKKHGNESFHPDYAISKIKNIK